MPQLVNALLSQHNFILLGLRGQAKTRLLRALVTLLDEEIPVDAGLRDQRRPAGADLRRVPGRIAAEGDDRRSPGCIAIRATSRSWRRPTSRSPTWSATSIRSRRRESGLQLSSELTMHYGLLPRANRGIFAINELPDLAGKIQVGLFNILQEGDVQIKGYPVRLPLDVLMAFTANPEDYTARGKIITPLKDRIGSEIRTHYPAGRADAMAITAQEAWLRAKRRRADAPTFPTFVAEVVEEIAFQARQDRRIDKRSGVSQRLPISAMENVVSNAERRAIVSGEAVAVAARDRRLRGAAVDHRQVRDGVRGRAEGRRDRRARPDSRRGRHRRRRLPRRTSTRAQVIEWFDLGGSLQLSDTMSAAEVLAHARQVQGLVELAHAAGVPTHASAPLLAAGIDFVLEGLYATKKISRSEERGYHGAEPAVRKPAREMSLDDEPRVPSGGGRKKIRTTDRECQ